MNLMAIYKVLVVFGILCLVQGITWKLQDGVDFVLSIVFGALGILSICAGLSIIDLRIDDIEKRVKR